MDTTKCLRTTKYSLRGGEYGACEADFEEGRGGSLIKVHWDYSFFSFLIIISVVLESLYSSTKDEKDVRLLEEAGAYTHLVVVVVGRVGCGAD